MNPLNHNPKSYNSLCVLPLSDVLPRVGQQDRLYVGDGETVNLNSQRLHLFKTKGVICVSCGLEGTYFSAEKSKKGNDKSYHLNLYSSTGTLLTKDHIVAKSKGGKNCLSNYQTMCSPCNKSKGSD